MTDIETLRRNLDEAKRAVADQNRHLVKAVRLRDEAAAALAAVEKPKADKRKTK